jgi:hypothetical protein
MNTQAIAPTDSEISVLRNQIGDAKRLAEYNKLKEDLHDITYKAVNTPNEFSGSMQMPDTEKVLQTKRKSNSLADLFISRTKGMLSVRPVIGSVIALLLASIALFFVFSVIDNAWFIKYRIYFSSTIQIAAGIAIIKSASRSLLLPLVALFVGGAIAASLNNHGALFYLNRASYEHLMIVGLVGICISIMTID